MKQFAVGLRSPFGERTRHVYAVGAKTGSEAIVRAKEKHGRSDSTDYWVMEIKKDVQHICSYPIANPYVG